MIFHELVSAPSLFCLVVFLASFVCAGGLKRNLPCHKWCSFLCKQSFNRSKTTVYILMMSLFLFKQFNVREQKNVLLFLVVVVVVVLFYYFQLTNAQAVDGTYLCPIYLLTNMCVCQHLIFQSGKRFQWTSCMSFFFTAWICFAHFQNLNI